MVMNYFREKKIVFYFILLQRNGTGLLPGRKKKSNLIPQNILHVRHVPNPITFNIYIYIYIYLLVNLYLFKW